MTRATGRQIGVGFDIDHTIAIDNKLERIAFLRLAELVAERGGQTPRTLDEETTAIDELLVCQRRGDYSIDRAVCRFVSERGIRTGMEWFVRRFRTMALDMVDELVIPLPGARATFGTLRDRGIRAAVLSNGWNPLQLRKARRAGFDGPVLASGDLGVQKPDARAFAALLTELQTQAELTWYVGDDPRIDVEGARAAGLQAVWLDAEGRVFPADLPAPARITALPELEALLRDEQEGATARAPQESA